ncbi:MAG: shikimate kinase [Thermoplasmata archaeon]|nr:shikimate kinase [Thermoplasmata archaeon]
MRGVGAGTAAISFVNALFTGTGAAAAIGITATATVELQPAPHAGHIVLEAPSDTPLARASVLDAIRRYGDATEVDARIRIDSAIPVAKGLKSSSAVGVAIARAVAAAYGRNPTDEEVARASAEVSQTLGVSATGAFDDALASAAGGVVVTDNRSRRVRLRGFVDPDWALVLWTPSGTHALSPAWTERFAAERVTALAAVEAAERGEWLTALSANTEIVERVMGYDYRPLRRALERSGALGSGVSGLGPALATIAPRARLRDVLRGHPAGTAAVAAAEFVPPDPRGSGSG